MEFPFPVPEHLTTATDEVLAELSTQVREYAQTLLADDDADPAALVAIRNLHVNVQAQQGRRTQAAAAADAQAARAQLAADLAEPTPAPDQPEPTPQAAPTDPAPAATPPADPAPNAVTASGGGNPRSTIDQPPAPPAERYAVMLAASDAPGNGAELANFRAAGEIISNRISGYSSSTKANTRAKRVGRHGYVIGGRSLTRHGNVTFRREFPTDLRIDDTSDAMAVLDHAADERRLPGGSLRESARLLVAAGRSLTAAVGWCSPSETIYDLCELETLDGMLDIAEVEAVRGGFFVPEDGGPNFASIFEGIGDEGDVILTEYDIENGGEKVCLEIPCPPFAEVRLDVAYVCLTGSLLQRRGYPEAVTRFSRGAMTALAHKVNASVIARIVAASGGPTVIPTVPGNDDDASRLLSAIELAIEDTKYRNRMGRATTLEVVLPAWTMAVIRAALARRTGVEAWAVTDAQILEAFTVRNAVPRFVYDWQDAFSGLVGGPGGASPITAFPDDLQFVVYPAGTWVKPVREVVNLDTVYDNALLTLNQYTALFAEDGFNVIQLCPESRLYQVAVDPADVLASGGVAAS